MRVGICEWTTFPASFEDELAAYRAAGAGAIGILEFKPDGVHDVRGKLRESRLAVTEYRLRSSRSTARKPPCSPRSRPSRRRWS
jgi:hypothetical protein